MCGIAGIVSKTNQIQMSETIYAMSQSIKHRGPDGEGFLLCNETSQVPFFSEETPDGNKQSTRYVFNPRASLQNTPVNFNLAFAHRRLSIIDLTEAGHQPMCDVLSKHWITFNGEIYNYIELKKELQDKGHQFVTQTDTEVLIEAYKEWGIDCLKKLNGMFSFSLFDVENNSLFCARDRVGVKPFYYINNHRAFAFASEYKAFIKSGLIKFEVNNTQQVEFLTQATLETSEESLFKNIKELKPAHYLLYNLSSHQLEIKQYYELPTEDVIQKTDAELIHLIEKKLVTAIKLRLRSDVAIGSCLSGGLDSSIIAGIINYLQPNETLKLFTATFPDEVFNESNYAKLVVDKTRADWYTVTPTAEEFFKDIETLNYSQDLPVWSTSTYSQHRVMQLAHQQNIKVVLDGQGADELFAGYNHHYIALWKERFSLKKLHDAKSSIKHPYKLFAKQLLKEKLNLQVDYSTYFNNSFINQSPNSTIPNNLNQALKEDYNGRLKSFLKCEDRCSMAFGIESRVPFADDVDLVNLLFSIQGNKKIKQGVSKYLLREASKQFIPKQIYERKDKIGFETPVVNWLLIYKKQVLETILTQLSFINKEKLNQEFDSLLINRPHFVLRLYSLSIWQKVYSV